MIENEQSLTVSIRYDMHVDDWKDLFEVYKEMPEWHSFSPDGTANWFGTEDDDTYITATVTTSGLLLEGEIEYDVWENWVIQFIKKASVALGYQVKITDF